MRVTLEHVGRIRRAELDLRPLTLFIGPNSTNKTWAAQCVAACVDALSWSSIAGRADGALVDGGQRASTADEIANTLLDGLPDGQVGTATASVSWEQLAAGATKQPVELPVRWLRRHWLPGLSDAAKVQFRIDARNRPWRWDRVNLTYRRTDRIESINAELVSDVGEWRPSLSVAAPLLALPADQKRAQPFVAETLRSLSYVRFSKVLGFPAERSAFAGQMGALVQDDDSEAPTVTAYRRVLQSALQGRRVESAVTHACEMLGDAMLAGRVRYADGQGVTFQDSHGVTYPLDLVASLVRAAAPWLLALSRRANEGTLLAIDEPELNAHPRAQLGIAELLATLPSLGVHVVATTHSPYIVDHIANLMRVSTLDAPAKKRLRKRLKTHAAWAAVDEATGGTATPFVDPEHVAVYHFDEQGNVTDALDRETGEIDWQTFGDETNFLNDFDYEVRSEALATAKTDDA